MIVSVVEPLGDRIHIHLTTQTGESIVARTASYVNLKPQQEVDVHIDMRQAHLFSPDATGRRLDQRGT